MADTQKTTFSRCPVSNPSTSGNANTPSGSAPAPTGATTAGSSSNAVPPGKPNAIPLNDPNSIKAQLKLFTPKGSYREKVVTLRDEAIKLKLKDNPIAFCLLLRSMFELSAKAYCKDHQLNTVKADGSDKSLKDILENVCVHLHTLPNGKTDQTMQRNLHGSITEIKKPESVLSVTSMNALVHNPKFSIISQDICIMFHKIYPLLEEMNN